jgi:hypothetical protein
MSEISAAAGCQIGQFSWKRNFDLAEFHQKANIEEMTNDRFQVASFK